jgi:hypothetical protein
VRHPDLESAHDQRLEGDRMLFSSKRATGSLEVRVLLRTSTAGETRCFDSTVRPTVLHPNNMQTTLYNSKARVGWIPEVSTRLYSDSDTSLTAWASLGEPRAEEQAGGVQEA